MPAHLIQNSFQFIDSNGLPVVGGSVEFYEPNGSSTPKAVYSDKALSSSAGSTATLNALGMFTAELFGSGDYYMIVKYADDTTAYDMEYIEGEGSGGNAATEWDESVTPTFIDATSFSVAGDLTLDFHVNRRVKTDNTGGTIYGTITDSVFTSLTTVTVVNDSGALDSGLSSVDLGALRADNQSMPASKAGLIDTNGNEVLDVGTTASANAQVKITNGIDEASIESVGDNADVDLNVITKGTGGFKSNGDLVLTQKEEGSTSVGLSNFVNFTSIPATAKHITVIAHDVSCTSTPGAFALRIGTGGSVSGTGYQSVYSRSLATATTTDVVESTAYMLLGDGRAGTASFCGVADLYNVSGNVWVYKSINTDSAGGSLTALSYASGEITLAGVLDIIQFTTTTATNFDAGSVNIFYR